MAKRGDIARASIMDTIANAFAVTGNFIAVQDKKIYVTANDGGEIIQFAISVTMPKTPVAPSEMPAAGGDTSAPAPVVTREVKLSDDDKAAVAQLMKDLGIE